MLFGAAVFAAAGLAPLPARSGAVFDINAVTIVPGAGFGVDRGEGNRRPPTLLDMRFRSSEFVAQSFALGQPSDSYSFAVGTADMKERNAGQGIRPAEMDGLSVLVQLAFADTLATLDMVGIGTATPGSISDRGIDFTIEWAPRLISFGSGGLLEFDIQDLAFAGRGMQYIYATVTLITPESSAALAISEPTSLLVLGSGCLVGGLLFARRRRTAREPNPQRN